MVNKIKDIDKLIHSPNNGQFSGIECSKHFTSDGLSWNSPIGVCHPVDRLRAHIQVLRVGLKRCFCFPVRIQKRNEQII